MRSSRNLLVASSFADPGRRGRALGSGNMDLIVDAEAVVEEGEGKDAGVRKPPDVSIVLVSWDMAIYRLQCKEQEYECLCSTQSMIRFFRTRGLIT